jgi:hypothetical protein
MNIFHPFQLALPMGRDLRNWGQDQGISSYLLFS